ncbi:hypothetical protein Daus18300_011450 [Diaporthe australafricana]|uniref:HMG box domain-containing protein n=1 Tax=Diaporthe australafricana TaxID=127596 RepID=A0ABR3W6K8_9PEZI
MSTNGEPAIADNGVVSPGEQNAPQADQPIDPRPRFTMDEIWAVVYESKAKWAALSPEERRAKTEGVRWATQRDFIDKFEDIGNGSSDSEEEDNAGETGGGQCRKQVTEDKQDGLDKPAPKVVGGAQKQNVIKDKQGGQDEPDQEV